MLSYIVRSALSCKVELLVVVELNVYHEVLLNRQELEK